MSPPVTNIAAALPAMAEKQPDTMAIAWPDGRGGHEERTFRELDEDSGRLAAALTEYGIGRGVRTVVMVPPGRDLFALVFALFKAGAVPVLVDPGMGIQSLKACLDEAEPQAFIGIPKAQAARVILGWGRRTITKKVTAGARLFWGGTTMKKLRAAANDVLPTVDTAASDVAAILFTSGSTGVPKGAIYTHGNFLAQVERLRETYGIEPGEVDLPTFPLFALFDPALGMSAVIPEMDATRPAAVDPTKILAAVEKYQVTNMFGSPALLHRVGAYGAKHGAKLPSLRRVVSAGAPVQAAVIERFAQMLPAGAQVHTPYGATEALPVSSIGSNEILGETASQTDRGMGVCVGRPVVGMEARIIGIDDSALPRWTDDLELPEGEIGEIVVRGAVVTQKYYGRPDATNRAKIQDPSGGFWHRMGDVGYCDVQGRLWFCGRMTHRVKLADRTLFSVQCEGVFNAHPDVYRTALVGVKRGRAMQPVLCVERHPGRGADTDRLSRELRVLGTSHAVTADVERFLFHDDFPVDIRHNAKIFREKLAVWAAEQLGVKALVTGGGGFLGSAIVRKLLARGDAVRSYARGAYPALERLGVECVRGDLADADAVVHAATGCDLIFHVAAKAGVWGKRADYERANVEGTRNVVQACGMLSEPRLVYTSTPSVTFAGSDQDGVDESAPYAEQFLCAYPETKAQAEQHVLASNGPGLATVALRPHLIWGPGDPHLVPRILERGRAGKLRLIGARENLVDSVYVDNAADAHLLAADRLAPDGAIAGKAFFITNGEPLPLAELINRILAAGGLPPVKKRIPAGVAYALGAVLEGAHRLFGVKREPLMTRFVAKQLSTAHYFDISAARRDLGYDPVVSLDEGMARLAESLKS